MTALLAVTIFHHRVLAVSEFWRCAAGSSHSYQHGVDPSTNHKTPPDMDPPNSTGVSDNLLLRGRPVNDPTSILFYIQIWHTVYHWFHMISLSNQMAMDKNWKPWGAQINCSNFRAQIDEFTPLFRIPDLTHNAMRLPHTSSKFKGKIWTFYRKPNI